MTNSKDLYFLTVKNFFWNIVDLQCYISFRYTEKWLSYTYMCIYIYIYTFFFYFLFHNRLLQDIEYSSLLVIYNFIVKISNIQQIWKDFTVNTHIPKPRFYY